jgi:hypothetical protein
VLQRFLPRRRNLVLPFFNLSPHPLKGCFIVINYKLQTRGNVMQHSFIYILILQSKKSFQIMVQTIFH